MHLVASIRPARSADTAVAALAAAAGLAPAEARMRLAPEPPALLARLPEAEATRLVDALRASGLEALALDEHVPTDADRLVARSFVLEGPVATFTARDGEALLLPWDSVRLVLRGVRAARTRSEHTETGRKLALGRAVVTGGLMLTKKTQSTTRDSHEETEHLLLVHGEGGERVLLAEHALELSGLGPRLQPSRTANMGVLAEELRRRAPAAFFDDRLVRLGRRGLPFVLGGEHAVRTASSEVQRTDTRSAVDVVAEVLDRAVRAGLLP